MNIPAIESSIRSEIAQARDQVTPWFHCDGACATWLPPHGGWSIAEILRHIALTSHYLLLLIDKGTRKSLKAKANGAALAVSSDYELVPDALAAAGVFQAFPWHRPAHMDPRLHSLPGEVTETILQQLQRCEEAVVALEGGWGFHSKTMMTVNGIGKLDVYQYIVFLCRHIRRHCAQMAQNKVDWEAQGH